jgi:transposase
MAKKEAHAQALKMFIESKGKTPLKAIAKAVEVSPFSVGRWHKQENWKGKIGEGKEAPAAPQGEKVEEAKPAPRARRKGSLEEAKAAPTIKRRKRAEGIVIRKKDLFDQAVQMFQKSGGKVSNLELSKKLKISAATIAKWKKMPEWSQGAAVTASPEPSKAAPPPQAVPRPEAAAVDVEAITAPQDLILLNQKVRSMLEREHLTAGELVELSEAKLTLLEAAEVFLGIVKGTRE